jgi:cytochrome c-type biogenesis protein CcmF
MACDNYEVKYVWLYTSPGIDLYKKIANLFVGDEGGVLWLALFLTAYVHRCSPDSDLLKINSGIAAWYVLAVAVINPLSVLSADYSHSQPGGGLNAHLDSVWLLFHPPLIFFAYALIINQGAIAVLYISTSSRISSHDYLKRIGLAWTILSAGIGFGIAWAFEDAAYGQYWHWDPVQTSLLCIWLLLTACLHLLREQLTRLRSLILGVCVIASALLVPISLAITRSDIVASSHHYIGDTSLFWHLGFIGYGVILVSIFWYGGKRVSTEQRVKTREGGVWEDLIANIHKIRKLDYVALAVLFCVFIAADGVLTAYLRNLYQTAKSKSMMPFYETLRAWSGGDLNSAVLNEFQRWDVDGYSIVGWLSAATSALFTYGGWYYARRVSKYASYIFIALNICAILYLLRYGGYLADQYQGAGIFSDHAIEYIPILDALILAAAGFVLGNLAWVARVTWGSVSSLSTLSSLLPFSLIHSGFAILLIGLVTGTVLNSYVQHVESIGDSGLIERNLGDGYKYSIVATGLPLATENVQAPANVSYARVKLGTPNGEYQLSGKVFANRSEINFVYAGPVKAICELIDYRYARVKGNAAYVLHPLVHRSFIEDIQVWIYGPNLNSLDSKKDIVVVVKMFRFSSFVWFGAILLSIGGFWLSFKRFRSGRTYALRFVE